MRSFLMIGVAFGFFTAPGEAQLRVVVDRSGEAERRAVGPHHAQSRPPDNLGEVNLRGGEIDLGHRSVIPVGLPNSWRGIPWSRSGSGCLDPRQPITGWCSGRPRESHSASGARMETTNEVVRCCSGQARQGFVNGGYSFVPDAGRFRDPMSSTAADWALPYWSGPPIPRFYRIGNRKDLWALAPGGPLTDVEAARGFGAPRATLDACRSSRP